MRDNSVSRRIRTQNAPTIQQNIRQTERVMLIRKRISRSRYRGESELKRADYSAKSSTHGARYARFQRKRAGVDTIISEPKSQGGCNATPLAFWWR